MTWTAPTGTTPPAEIDYVTTVAFRFDVDRASAVSQASLGVVEAGTPADLTIQTLGPAAPVGPPPGSFFTLAPCRLVDTRDVNSPSLAANQSRTFAVSTQCGVPATAKAVALNVTAIGGTTDGHVVVYSGGTVPNTASLSYSASQTRANNMVVALDVDGSIKVFVGQAAGTVDLAIDVTGYFE